jgi:hypothetical protein
MSRALIFMTKWRKWQRELRCRKGFGLIDSFRFGLWLARSGWEPKAGPETRYAELHAPIEKGATA